MPNTTKDLQADPPAPSSDKKKIYCFNNGGQSGFLLAVALCEDGVCLAQHACSSEGYMRHDLGMVGEWKHENYNAHCGVDGWELEWVDEPKKHPGLMLAFTLNQASASKEGESHA